MAAIQVFDDTIQTARLGSAITTTNITNKVVATGFNIAINNTGATGVEADGLVAYGNNLTINGARATIVGNFIRSTGISNTAVGYGVIISNVQAISGVSTSVDHGLGLGRGVFVPASNTTVIGGGVFVQGDVYFNNGWAHRLYDPANANYPNPAAIFNRDNTLTPTVLHGADAYDNVDGTSVNQPGGNLVLMAGRSTGTGAGGKVVLAVANGTNLGSNTKQATVNALEADTNTTTGQTKLLLYDNTTGTLRRVIIDGSNFLKVV